MAGDWIKVELVTPDKPEIHQMAEHLNVAPEHVLGAMIRVWVWADQQSIDGNAIHVTEKVVDRISNLPNLAGAMREVGWLSGESDALTLPNFGKNNGQTAKRRAETQARVAKHRSGNAPVTERPLVPRPIRSAIKARDNSTCRYCGRKEGEYTPPETSGDAEMHIDHVVPVARGGVNTINNMVCACAVCNMHKSNRTPDECGLEWPVDVTGKRLGRNEKSVTESLPEKRREENIKPEQKPTSSAPSDKPLDATDPLNGCRIPLVDKTEFTLPQKLVTELEAAYPAVDIGATLREIRAWCLTNPTRCKTRRGAPAFINRWFAKEQNRG